MATTRKRVSASSTASPPTFKLGKKPAVIDSRTLNFGAYLTAQLPAPPASVDWGSKVKTWPMYDNDRYGDCTCAAAGHMIQAWTAAAGRARTPTGAAVLAFYKHFTPPGPENGCDMLTVLRYWQNTGLARDKIGAYAQLEPHNLVQLQDAVSLFGGCYIGVELPKFVTAALQQGRDVPWVVPPGGAVGEGAPDPNGGHCIPAVAYDARNIYIVTWGAIKPMSWEFYRAYSDEAYAILTQDFLAGDKAPNGFDMNQLQQDLAGIHTAEASRAAVSRRLR